jgi:hypothetical protein
LNRRKQRKVYPVLSVVALCLLLEIALAPLTSHVVRTYKTQTRSPSNQWFAAVADAAAAAAASMAARTAVAIAAVAVTVAVALDPFALSLTCRMPLSVRCCKWTIRPPTAKSSKRSTPLVRVIAVYHSVLLTPPHPSLSINAMNTINGKQEVWNVAVVI